MKGRGLFLLLLIKTFYGKKFNFLIKTPTFLMCFCLRRRHKTSFQTLSNFYPRNFRKFSYKFYSVDNKRMQLSPLFRFLAIHHTDRKIIRLTYRNFALELKYQSWKRKTQRKKNEKLYMCRITLAVNVNFMFQHWSNLLQFY